MMKTVFLFAIAALVSTATFSQARIGIQAHGGLNSGYFESTEATSLSQKAHAGFGTGIVSEVSLSQRFSLRPSLNFARRGIELTGKGVNTEGPGNVAISMKANFNYIELPVMVAYNVAVGNNKAYVGIGPSVGFGISGKTKMTYSVLAPNVPAETETEKVSSFKKQDDGGAGFKRPDAGAAAIAGMQFNSGAFVNLSGVYGLTNNFEKDGGLKYQSRSVNLTVGFLLN